MEFVLIRFKEVESGYLTPKIRRFAGTIYDLFDEVKQIRFGTVI